MNDVEISARQERIRRTVPGRPHGYELDKQYVDTPFVRYLIYRVPEDGSAIPEDSADYFGYAYIEVYNKRDGNCPKNPTFVYVAETAWDYDEFVTSKPFLSHVRLSRGGEFDH